METHKKINPIHARTFTPFSTHSLLDIDQNHTYLLLLLFYCTPLKPNWSVSSRAVACLGDLDSGSLDEVASKCPSRKVAK